MKKLWSNNYHHSNNDPKVDGSCKKEDWQTSNNPKRINPAHCQRPSNVKNDVTCGGIPQQWMKARWRRRTRSGRGPQCGRQRHKWWNPKMESINVTNNIHDIYCLHLSKGWIAKKNQVVKRCEQDQQWCRLWNAPQWSLPQRSPARCLTRRWVVRSEAASCILAAWESCSHFFCLEPPKTVELQDTWSLRRGVWVQTSALCLPSIK